MSFTVLIADDEAMPRTVLKEHIPWEELSVTQVHLATDGEEAGEQARRFRPEIIISDIKMPRRNGLEMAAAVREFLPACQFIFLSGYSDKEYLKGAIRLRAACYVEKPLDLSEITAALREVTAELLRQRGYGVSLRRSLLGPENASVPLGAQLRDVFTLLSFMRLSSTGSFLYGCKQCYFFSSSPFRYCLKD